VAFNPQFLMEGIEVAGGDSITLATIDELKPAVVRGVDADDFLYLIMPVRVS
jgi:DNA polymerase-3 subunit beta